ncbi:docking protein 2-like [Lytechinus pictus]|uniref:docking protein 2-like n=1 Tax=Lytechinus pictus TaxID=7653 RepID=UPI0030B9DDFF
MDGTLWRYQKVTIASKKWVKNTAKLSWATSQVNYGTLTLTDREKKVQIKLSNTSKFETMPAQYKNRDHTFEVTCMEEKVHLLAAEDEDRLFQWVSKMHDVAGLRKDHLFGGGGGGGGGGCGGGKSENQGVLEVESELQDNLLYDSYDNKTFPVAIKSYNFTEPITLGGTYNLQLDSMKLSLIEASTGKNILSWPYRYLRRYGRETNSFSMEVGRRCTSGEGLIRFNVEDGNKVFAAIQEFVSAMTGRNFSSSSTPTTPTTAPQAPPSFTPAPTEPKAPVANQIVKTQGVKVLPTPRDRTHSAGSRNIAPKPANRTKYSNRGAQSVDDVSRSEPIDQCYSSVSDEAIDLAKKLPSPKTRKGPPIDFEPEQHYDVASEPTPKQWPQMQRRQTANGESNGTKAIPTSRVSHSSGDKSSSKVDTLNNEMSGVVIDDNADPGLYSTLETPPGMDGAAAADASQVYSEASDHDHIYDHLARQKLGNSSAAPRLPPPNTKPAAVSKASAASAAKSAPQEEDDMLYDHLNRGQTGSAQPGNSPVGAVPEDAYDILSLDAPSGSPTESGYLVGTYPSSTVPEESEYAEANDANFNYDENLYEVA